MLHSLRNEIAELRDAIDWLREEIGWGNRNLAASDATVYHFIPDAIEPAIVDRLTAMQTPNPPSPPVAPSDPPDMAPRLQERLF